MLRRQLAVGDKVHWVHDVPGSGYQPRQTVLMPGTVVALDLPGLPGGVEVRFDRPDPKTGAASCYAAYSEIKRIT